MCIVIPKAYMADRFYVPGKYTFGVEFTRDTKGRFCESIPHLKLYVGIKEVAEGTMKA
jgi:arylsulfatase